MLNPLTTIKGLKNLHEIVNTKAKLSIEELSNVIKKANFKKYKRGEIIIKAGEVENYVSFILEGTMRTFFIKDEKEICLEFFFEGDFTGSYASFLTQTPSTLYQDALTNISLVQISFDKLQELYQEYPKFERINRMLTEDLFMKSSDKVIELLSMSAMERYEKLIEQHPKYYQNIPQKYLASYLNITPESLSRIRKQL
jgi:CRP-like cAMP-binding protein